MEHWSRDWIKQFVTFFVVLFLTSGAVLQVLSPGFELTPLTQAAVTSMLTVVLLFYWITEENYKSLTTLAKVYLLGLAIFENLLLSEKLIDTYVSGLTEVLTYPYMVVLFWLLMLVVLLGINHHGLFRLFKIELKTDVVLNTMILFLLISGITIGTYPFNYSLLKWFWTSCIGFGSLHYLVELSRKV